MTVCLLPGITLICRFVSATFIAISHLSTSSHLSEIVRINVPECTICFHHMYIYNYGNEQETNSLTV